MGYSRASYRITSQGRRAAGQLNRGREVVVLLLWDIPAASAPECGGAAPHLRQTGSNEESMMWYAARRRKWPLPSRAVSPSRRAIGRSNRVQLRPSPLPRSSGPVRDGSTSEALRYGTCSQGISQFYLHTHTFVRNRNEPYLLLPSQL